MGVFRWVYILWCGCSESDGQTRRSVLSSREKATDEVVSVAAADRVPGTSEQASGHLLFLLGGSHTQGQQNATVSLVRATCGGCGKQLGGGGGGLGWSCQILQDCSL